MFHRLSSVALSLALAAPSLGAQSIGSLPPVRQVNIRLAQSDSEFRGRPDAVVLANGSVILLDNYHRRLLNIDPTLAEWVTIFDANTPAPMTFPSVPPRLLLGRGDTAYMTDLPARGLRIISPDGSLVRRQGLPNSEDLARVTNTLAAPQFAGPYLYFTETLVPRVSGDFSAEPHDSVYLTRVELATRRRDTLGVVLLKQRTTTVRDDSVSGAAGMTVFWDPFVIGDAISMNSFGDLAVIRAADFHVDWFAADGTRRSSPPVAWPWKRIDDSSRAAIIAKNEEFLERGRVVSRENPDRAGSPVTMKTGRVPDREPAFVPMSAIPDRNGLIWLQVGAKMAGDVYGPPTYAAIDRSGKIVDRIALPAGRTLIGFDKAGRIYAITYGPAAKLELYRPR